MREERKIEIKEWNIKMSEKRNKEKMRRMNAARGYLRSRGEKKS